MRTKCLAAMSMRYAVLVVVVPLVMGKVEFGEQELEETLEGVSARDVDGHGDFIRSRQEIKPAGEKRQSNNSTNYNDVQANIIGVDKALGWDYDFCRIEWPRTAVIDNKLYIDGGTLWLSPKGEGLKSTREINTRLLEIDISSPISRDNYTVRAISKPTSAPNVGAGQVFMPPSWPSPNNGRFYTYGGYFPSFNRSLDTYIPPSKDPQGDLYSYDTKSDKWAKVSMAKDSDQVIWAQEGTSVSIPELGLGFYLGGYQNSSTNSVFKDNEYRSVPGFLRLEWDVKDPNVAPKWKNETTVPFDQTIGGSLVHIPDFGEKGILVKFGGYGVIAGDNLQMTGNAMDQIYIYDIAQATWYQQKASANGDIPNPRGYTCSVVVPAKDKSSYNIYVYGGGGRAGGDGLDDLWVLSLPSFVWVNIYAKGGFSVVGMSCHLFNDNQILLVGPRVKRVGNKSDATMEPCRPLWSVYDITQSQWVSEFSPLNTEAAPVSRTISSVIGGGGSGSATLTKPKGGWDDPKLKAVFEYKRSNTTDEKYNRGALIGGLIGALPVLLVPIAFCVRRRERLFGRLAFIGRKRKTEGDSLQEMDAPLPQHPSPEGYHGQDPRKYDPEQPPQELAGQYPWAEREGMRDGPRSEMGGALEHKSEGVVSETPPSQLQQSKPQQGPDWQHPQAMGLLQQREIARGSPSMDTPPPPPEASRPQTQPESTSRLVAGRKEVESGGDGGC